MIDRKWIRITPDNMHSFNESMDNYKWIDSSVGKSLYLPSQPGGGINSYLYYPKNLMKI